MRSAPVILLETAGFGRENKCHVSELKTQILVVFLRKLNLLLEETSFVAPVDNLSRWLLSKYPANELLI